MKLKDWLNDPGEYNEGTRLQWMVFGLVIFLVGTGVILAVTFLPEPKS